MAEDNALGNAITGFAKLKMKGTLREGFMLLAGAGFVASASKLSPGSERDYLFYLGITVSLPGAVLLIWYAVRGAVMGREK